MHPHLRWTRLPDVSVWRSPPAAGGPRRPFHGDPRAHGQTLADAANAAVKASSAARLKLGIDPPRLRVLRFTFLGVEERALLERFGVRILDEGEERHPLKNPYYEVLVEFASAGQAAAFQAAEPGESTASRWWLPERDSAGGASPTRLRVCFSDREVAKAFIADTSTAAAHGYKAKVKQPTKVRTTSTFKVLVEFVSDDSLRNLGKALRWYRQANQEGPAGLTEIQARQLFDALTSIDTVAPDDRRGARLRRGMPLAERFFLDVDLWHPGLRDLVAEAITQFRTVVAAANGRVTDGPTAVAQTLFLARVEATPETLQALLTYDRVAYVDLPPPASAAPISILSPVTPPASLSPIPPDGPLACLVDSGVVAAHPLLAGVVVDERDFDSGENTPVDRCGHGTHLAGLIVYGDVARCVREGRWEPRVRLLSAKVMRDVGGAPGFDDQNEVAIHTQLQKAIRAFATEHGCRVFNLSLGDLDRPYDGGRQLPWALLLDELARELDVVLVVSSGNAVCPEIPPVRTSTDFQAALREQLLAGSHKLIDPATALLALTVGAVARSAAPFVRADLPGVRPALVGAPAEGPPPFARVGHIESMGAAPQRAVKPDLCAYGGNAALNDVGTGWRQHEPQLDEPSLNFEYQRGRLLAGLSGSSPAAAAVTHCCAVVEAELRRRGTSAQRPSANLIRALVVHSARPADDLTTWMADGVGEVEGERRRLRVAGHGRPDPDRAAFSTDSRVVLVTDDEIEDGRFHLYELELPDALLNGTGTRRIRVTLAFDPPVRGTRKEYLGRTMWVQLFRGMTAESIRAALAKIDDPNTLPTAGGKLSPLKARPTSSMLEWSTVQCAEFETSQSRALDHRPDPAAPAVIHILVGSALRFAADESTTQRYALVTSLEHEDTRVKLYQPVRQQVERLRERLRARRRG
jgi:subtilase family protein